VAINESLPLPDIGVDVIRQFVVEYDRIHERVAFSPLFRGREFMVPGERTCGLSISFRQKQRLVRDVLPGRAPAKAGIVRGDTIVAINGRDAELVTYREWDEIVRGSSGVTVTWSHGGAERSERFPVVELK